MNASCAPSALQASLAAMQQQAALTSSVRGTALLGKPQASNSEPLACYRPHPACTTFVSALQSATVPAGRARVRLAVRGQAQQQQRGVQAASR